MSQEYEGRWHSLNTAQMQTSEAVAALEDMSDMKSVMQGRIGETEARLGQLRSWHEELAGKQDDFQAKVQEELLHIKSALESSDKPQDQPTCKPLSTTFTCNSKPSAAVDLECLGSKPLSVTAPVFIPSAGSTTLCGGGGITDATTEGSGSTSMQRPPPFDGKSTWEAYRTVFTVSRAKRLDRAAESCLSRNQPERVSSDCTDEHSRRTTQGLHCLVCCFVKPLWKYLPSRAQLSTAAGKDQA